MKQINKCIKLHKSTIRVFGTLHHALADIAIMNSHSRRSYSLSIKGWPITHFTNVTHTHSVRPIIRLKINTNEINMYNHVSIYVYNAIIRLFIISVKLEIFLSQKYNNNSFRNAKKKKNKIIRTKT